MEAEARPVRRPPSSCLSDWVAPCMRRFTSLMSKLPVGITLSRFSQSFLSRRLFEKNHSAGNDGPATGSAQDLADRARLGNREYDDRQRRLAGKGECGRIHDLVAAFDCLRMRQAVEALGGWVLFGIGVVDPVDIGGLENGLG